MGGTPILQSAVLKLQAHAVHLLMFLNYVFLPFNWGMLYRRQKWNFLMGISLIYKTREKKGCNRYKDECPVVHTEKGVEGSSLLLCSLPNWGSVGAEERIRVCE